MNKYLKHIHTLIYTSILKEAKLSKMTVVLKKKL